MAIEQRFFYSYRKNIAKTITSDVKDLMTQATDKYEEAINTSDLSQKISLLREFRALLEQAHLEASSLLKTSQPGLEPLAEETKPGQHTL